MNLWLILARFFGQQLFIRLSPLCSCTTTHQATQNLLKQIYSSPSASRRLRRFFKSTFWITSSSARLWSASGVSLASRKQDFWSEDTKVLKNFPVREAPAVVCRLAI